MKDQKASIVSIATAEEERRTKLPASFKETPVVSRKGLFTLIGSGVLILAGMAMLGLLFVREGNDAETSLTPPAFIFVDETKEVSATGLSRESLLQSLVVARNETSLSLGLIRQVYLTTQTGTTTKEFVPAASFVSLLSPEAPTDLLRTLENPFMLGVHVFEGNQPFLIFKVDVFDQAFRAMLDFEPRLEQALTPLFSRVPRPRLPGESTQATPARFLESHFVDRIIDNRDTRALTDDSGKILLLWTFLDRRTLVITTNEHTLREIVSRLKNAPRLPLP